MASLCRRLFRFQLALLRDVSGRWLLLSATVARSWQFDLSRELLFRLFKEKNNCFTLGKAIDFPKH